MSKDKNKHNPISAVALASVLWAAQPFVAQAQTSPGSSVFDVGGGLLLEPLEPSTLQPGTIPTTTVGEAAPAARATAGGGGGPSQGTGPLFTLGLSSGLFYEDDDDDGTEAYWGTFLSGVAFTQTRNQRLRLGVEGLLRFDEVGTTDIFTEPAVDFDYAVFNRATELALTLNLRESDVNSGFLPADFDGDDLNFDEGTQRVTNARVQLITGRDTRFGTTTRLAYNQLEYFDTIDPDLNDRVLLTASTELRFSLDRRVELTASARWQQRDEEDALETLETDITYGLGAEILLDRAWTASVDLSATSEEVETTLGTATEDGYRVATTLTRFMPNGRLAFAGSYASLDGVGTLTATRAMELANGAALTATAGVFMFDGGDVLPNLGLSYRQEILRGQTVSLNLTQLGSQNADGDETLYRTILNGSYQHALTRNSSLSINGSLASAEVQEGTSDDTLATSFGIAYSQDLTRDWALVARADTRSTFTEGDRTDRENTFSLSLERSFSFRP